MKTFGDLRSRMHNGQYPSWGELEALSLQDNYEEQIVPYLASFPDFCNRTKFCENLGELERDLKIAPFFTFGMDLTASFYRSRSSFIILLERLRASPLRHKIVTLHTRNQTFLEGEMSTLFCNVCWENLTNVRLVDVRMGNEAAHYLKSLRHLKVLDLSFNEISDPFLTEQLLSITEILRVQKNPLNPDQMCKLAAKYPAKTLQFSG